MATLALDVKALIVALGGGEPAFLVGQDWGHGIIYNVVAAFPRVAEREGQQRLIITGRCPMRPRPFRR